MSTPQITDLPGNYIWNQAKHRQGHADIEDVLEGIRHQRVATGNVAAGSTQEVTITWDTPFTDDNYTVTAQVHSAQGVLGTSLRIFRITAVTSSGCSVSVRNDDSLAALSGTVHAIAIHDT